jgi:hypothetical protein
MGLLIDLDFAFAGCGFLRQVNASVNDELWIKTPLKLPSIHRPYYSLSLSRLQASSKASLANILQSDDMLCLIEIAETVSPPPRSFSGGERIYLRAVLGTQLRLSISIQLRNQSERRRQIPKKHGVILE